MAHAVKKKVPDVNSGFLNILGYSVRWILFSGVLMIAFLFYAALYSYSENDPAWTNATGQDAVQNWMGPIGANAAAIGNMLFGDLVYIIPLVLCLCFYQLLIKTVRYRFEVDTLAIKLVVLLVFIAVGCGLFQVATGINAGVIGDVMGNRLLFNLIGLFPFLAIDYLWYFVIVLLVFLFFISLIILTGTMPLYWIDKVGGLWLLLFSWASNFFSRKNKPVEAQSSLARVSHLMSKEEISEHGFETIPPNFSEIQPPFNNEPVFYDENSFVDEKNELASYSESSTAMNVEHDEPIDLFFNAQSINAVPEYDALINSHYGIENIEVASEEDNIHDPHLLQVVAPSLFSGIDNSESNHKSQNEGAETTEPHIDIDSFSHYQSTYFSRLANSDAEVVLPVADVKDKPIETFYKTTTSTDSHLNDADDVPQAEQNSIALPFGKLYQSSFNSKLSLVDEMSLGDLGEKKREIVVEHSDLNKNNLSDYSSVPADTNQDVNSALNVADHIVMNADQAATNDKKKHQEPIHPAWSEVIQQRKSLLSESILTPKFDIFQNVEEATTDNKVSVSDSSTQNTFENHMVSVSSNVVPKQVVKSDVSINAQVDKMVEMPPENSGITPLINTATRKMGGYEVDPRTGAPKPLVNRIFPNQGQLPPLSLLTKEPPKTESYHQDELDYMAGLIEVNLKHFGIAVKVVHIDPGPVITRFELDLAPGIKVAQINNLDKDLARGLSVTSLRVVDIIPGKPYVGLEIPNRYREMVYFRTGMETAAYQQSKHPLTLVLGKNTSGEPVIANLAKMPHLLVAGTTGSGKSVGINTMLLSMLFKAQADELRMILIDPKMLELANYNDIPHLLTPVITDMKDAANALRWCVSEMERRYLLMSKLKVKGFDSYNALVKNALLNGGSGIPDPLWVKNDHVSATQMRPTLQPFYYIVVVIDEFADMMMQVGKKCEELIARLAQKARASGIHLIVATQRPSADVLTGIIKANIPTRIAFQVSSKIDSRVVLEKQGAESLLGNGDMLFMAPGSGEPVRVHGAFVNEKEVNDVADFLRLTGEPEFIDDVTQEPTEVIAGLSIEASGVSPSESDPLFDDAVKYVVESKKTSVSALQRRMKIGFNRAANLMEEMEKSGIVSTMSNGAREILIEAEDII